MQVCTVVHTYVYAYVYADVCACLCAGRTRTHTPSLPPSRTCTEPGGRMYSSRCVDTAGFFAAEARERAKDRRKPIDLLRVYVYRIVSLTLDGVFT